ncbi:DUF6744 family protein [Streptomyces sp. NPDC052236]|uniref:DUF6744 family protein n=1 Tax=Streptomyces sp. NPDC052236 TaxID=3365686 RepID=UPI0037D09D03
MTAQPATGDAAFGACTAAMDSGETPLLGHLVLYSVFDGEVTPVTLEAWFKELELDPQFLPPPVRQVDAYEKVTGPDGVKASYPLDDPSATGPAHTRARSRKEADRLFRGSSATLMVRHVRRDGGQIVRHVVREVRNPLNTSLNYDTGIGVATFHRDHRQGAAEGSGTLEVEPDNAAIARLPEAEQARVRAMLADIDASYQRRCTYLTGDKLRNVVRRYVESLGAIRVRATGGAYFVHRQHAATLAALRELVSRFGGESNLTRIPLPDQEEMRELVISSLTTKTREELVKLSRGIAAAQREGKHAQAQRLYQRFAELQKATGRHAELLSTSLEDAEAAMQLVKKQPGTFLAATATGGDDDE